MKQVLFLLLVLGTACSEEEQTEKDNLGDLEDTAEQPDENIDILIDEWTRESVLYGDVVLLFTDNGFYELEFDSGDQDPEIRGPFSIENNLLFLSSSDQGMYSCQREATYQIQREESYIILTPEQEDCQTRQNGLEGIWYRTTGNN